MNNLKIFCNIGKMLCACSGGIIGFISSGIIFIFPGIVLGYILGYMFERMITNPTLEN